MHNGAIAAACCVSEISDSLRRFGADSRASDEKQAVRILPWDAMLSGGYQHWPVWVRALGLPQRLYDLLAASSRS